MKSRILAAAVLILLSIWGYSPALPLEGEPYIHDPSTIMQCDGRFYTFGTGGGGLISDDGWTWYSGAVRPGSGAAPDAVKIGDRYLVAYGATGGGLGGGHNGRILRMWNKTLDPKSPDFKYSDAVVVASSDGVEDCDAIDPSLLLDPTDGRLWLTYGTFFGYIRLVELDPKTGKRVAGPGCGRIRQRSRAGRVLRQHVLLDHHHLRPIPQAQPSHPGAPRRIQRPGYGWV